MTTPYFKYRKNKLFCEGVAVDKIVKSVGTPCYIYSANAFVSQFKALQKAFKPVDPLICFAMKSNDSLAVLKLLAGQGAGADIVSVGELKKALLAGIDPKKIVFASVGKTEYEIREALTAGILFFNVESVPELAEIDRIAGALKLKASVALRINPDVHAPTHEKIATGTLTKKFGLDLAAAHDILRRREQFPHVTINGLHIHIGSQIQSVGPYVTAVKKVLNFLNILTQEKIFVQYFDLGGGFGIPYKNERLDPLERFADRLIPLIEKIGLNLIMEPGRFISGNSGIFVTETLYIKDNGLKKFIIVDAGMNDLVRPAMYDAHHEIIPVEKTAAQSGIYDVVGPICESADVFAKARRLPHVQNGDLLAIMSAGAYGYAMASNYNVRPRAVEVMVKGNQFSIIRERETFQDLIRGEKIPSFLKSKD